MICDCCCCCSYCCCWWWTNVFLLLCCLMMHFNVLVLVVIHRMLMRIKNKDVDVTGRCTVASRRPRTFGVACSLQEKIVQKEKESMWNKIVFKKVKMMSCENDGMHAALHMWSCNVGPVVFSLFSLVSLCVCLSLSVSLCLCLCLCLFVCLSVSVSVSVSVSLQWTACTATAHCAHVRPFQSQVRKKIFHFDTARNCSF